MVTAWRCCLGMLFLCLITTPSFAQAEESMPKMDAAFQQLGELYLDQFTAFSPIRATALGDHRFDDRLDELSDAARAKQVHWLQGIQQQLKQLDPRQLSRAHQVDYALMRQDVAAQIWHLTELQEWAWNPLVYTGLAGDSIYALMARDFAPRAERLRCATRRLEQFPRFLQQVRETLQVERVPPVHAETAAAQNRGALAIIQHLVLPAASDLPAEERQRLQQACAVAERAVTEHQQWLDTQLVPQAQGDHQLGLERFMQKLQYSLYSPLTWQEIRAQAEQRVTALHEEMYGIAKELYREQYPWTQFPETPSTEFRRAVIRFGLEKAYAAAPAADQMVEAAQQSVAVTTDFVRKADLVTIWPDPLDVIVMPEFQRGVSLAYCDAPGPLDVGQKTFYAVSPMPADWTEAQIRSQLREYNLRSLDVLTIHEAMPGHFLQLSHANRYPGKLRHLFSSGTFIEGWAVYTETMMCEAGFLNHDPLLKLVTLKWHLRDVHNAILDYAVHVEGISRSQAMQLLVEDAFQEEREAAGKWTRAQLTSAQLSTYFVGYLELTALRRETEQRWGDRFTLKAYHDKLLSFGSPPPQFARALLLDEEIPLDEPQRSATRQQP